MTLNTKRIVIFLLGLFLAGALLMVADQERRRHLAPEDMSLAQVSALVKDDSAGCVDCHATKSPGVTKQWQHSRHAEKGVGCNDCHKADKDDLVAWSHEGSYITSIVTPATCAECHPKENVEFAASHHNTAGMILHSKDNMLGEFVCGGPNAVLGCKQCHGSQISFTKHFEDGSKFELDLVSLSFDAMDAVMKSQNTDLKGLLRHKAALTAAIKARVDAAWAPHKGKAPKKNTRLDIDPQTWPNSGIGRFNPDGSLGSCNACHSRHEFSKALSRQPENCGKCHMGPDHPQIEIYNESKHGIAFRNKLAEMNLDHPEWVVGRDYSAAPTCATCHMSRYETADGVKEATHDVGLRISWTLRPPVSKLTTSHSARIGDDGEVEKFDVAWDQKRNDMKDVCAACHSNSHIEGFYSQYDALVNLYNEKFAKPGGELMTHMKKKGYFNKPDAKGFAHEMNWIWFELWHHEGRRMRHGAAMMGPDYTHWHGSYEVAKHFYTKYIPKVLKLAKENHDAELEKMVKDILKRPEHAWYDGQDAAEVKAVRKMYSGYYEKSPPKTEKGD